MKARKYLWQKLFELNERFPAEHATAGFARLNWQRYIVLRIWFMTKHNNALTACHESSEGNTPTSKTPDK